MAQAPFHLRPILSPGAPIWFRTNCAGAAPQWPNEADPCFSVRLHARLDCGPGPSPERPLDPAGLSISRLLCRGASAQQHSKPFTWRGPSQRRRHGGNVCWLRLGLWLGAARAAVPVVSHSRRNLHTPSKTSWVQKPLKLQMVFSREIPDSTF